MNNRILSPLTSILAALVFLAALQSCKGGSPKEEAQGTVYEIDNPLDTMLVDMGFTISVEEAGSDTAAIYHRAADQWLPVQWDDLDNDGQADELFFLATLGPGSETRLELVPGKEAPEEAPRAQVVFKTQATPFVVEDAREMKAPYEQQSLLEVPSDLTSQNMWVMFEGPVWENGLVAYRYYLDSRNRTDIYGKKVSALVMDTVGWDYHDIKDWGSDILKVGDALGIGAPAIWWNGKSYALEKAASKEVAVIANGPLRNIIRTTFTGLAIDTVVLNLIWEVEMHAGHYWTESRLRAGAPLPEGMYFATGIVRHLPAFNSGEEGEVLYGYNWGKQSYHEQQLGMALMAKKDMKPRLQETELDHLLIMEGNNERANYRFMAVWVEGPHNIKSEEAFRKLVQKESQAWSAGLSLEKEWKE